MPRKTKRDDVMMYLRNHGKPYWVKSDLQHNPGELNLAYYLDIKPRIEEGHYQYFSPDGIPITRYANGEFHLSPVNVTSYALGCLDMHIHGLGKQYLDGFLKLADWLCTHQVIHEGMGVWLYDYDWQHMKKPWISGMAQGEALSVLARAYQMTHDVKYINCARQALACFFASVEQGGVASRLHDGRIMFEEYPSVSRSTHVLNGFIYALWGIYDYQLVTGCPSAQMLWQQGVATLVQNLDQYDTGWWSYYNLADQNRIVSSFMYHNLHVVQLDILFDLTGESAFYVTRDRWSGYMKSPPNRIRALTVKVLEKFGQH